MGLFSKIVGEAGPKFVRVYAAPNQPEMDLVVSLLQAAEIPCHTKRTAGFDSPGLLAGGPRDILVPEHLEDDARTVIQPVVDASGAGDTPDARSSGAQG